MSILVTQSLHGAIEFYRHANSEWKEKAKEGLRKLLFRDYDEQLPEVAKRGIDFENMIYSTLRSNKPIEDVKCSDWVRFVLKSCKGGEFQKTVKKFITINDKEYCLYCKLDVWKPEENTIVDIKTTEKWTSWSEENYYKQLQHHLYCYTQPCETFEYLIAIFEDGKVKEVKSLPYYPMSAGEEREFIKKEIIKMENYLQKEEPEFFDAWRETYSLY